MTTGTDGGRRVPKISVLFYPGLRLSLDADISHNPVVCDLTQCRLNPDTTCSVPRVVEEEEVSDR